MPYKERLKSAKAKELKEAAVGIVSIKDLFSKLSKPVPQASGPEPLGQKEKVSVEPCSTLSNFKVGEASVPKESVLSEPSGQKEIVNFVQSCSSQSNTKVGEFSVPKEVISVLCEDESELNEPAKRRKIDKTHRTGLQSVLELNYPWLLPKYEKDLSGRNECVLYCRLCRKHNNLGLTSKVVWVTVGCKTLRKDKVKLHSLSDQHSQALLQEHAEGQSLIQAQSLSKPELACVEAMLEILLHIAKKNVALAQFSALVDLGLSIGSKDLLPIRQQANATYSSLAAVHELLEVLSDTLYRWLLPQIRESLTYSISIDEVADSASIKNLGVIIKFVDPAGELQVRFLSDREMSRATGAQIKETLLETLAEKNIDPLRCSNLTSDGASSFSGKKSGAANLLKEAMGDVIVLHCHDHRLALATRDAFAAVPVMDSVSGGLDSLYKYYKYSTVSAASLRMLQDVFNKGHFKLKQPKHHRWLSHDQCILTVLKHHSLFVQDLENATVSKESTRDRVKDAQGLLVWLTSEQVVRTLVLLADILPQLTELSLIYQRQDVDLACAEPVLNQTISTINKLKNKPGIWGRKLEKHMFVIKKANCNEKSFNEEVKLPFLQALKEKLEQRFINVKEISNLASLSLPIQDVNLMTSIPIFYREEEIQELADFFHLEDDDTEGKTVSEWADFISWLKNSEVPLLSNCSSSLPYLRKMFLDTKCDRSFDLRKRFPNLTYLYSVAATLALSSAEVERLFSHLKLIKDDRRSSLGNKRLNELLNVKLNMDDEHWPQLKREAAVTWLKLKNRRLKF